MKVVLRVSGKGEGERVCLERGERDWSARFRVCLRLGFRPPQIDRCMLMFEYKTERKREEGNDKRIDSGALQSAPSWPSPSPPQASRGSPQDLRVPCTFPEHSNPDPSPCPAPRIGSACTLQSCRHCHEQRRQTWVWGVGFRV